MQSAGEIYTFLEFNRFTQIFINYSKEMETIRRAAENEKVYGNMKQDAIHVLKSMIDKAG